MEWAKPGLDKDNAEEKSRRATKAQRKHSQYAVAPHFGIDCAPCLSVRGSCAGANLRGGALEEVAFGDDEPYWAWDPISPTWCQVESVCLAADQRHHVP